MNTTETQPASNQASGTQASAAKPALTPNQKRKAKAEGRKKRNLKLKTDKEFAKGYFEGKAKRAADKKSAFRKKKSKKK